MKHVLHGTSTMYFQRGCRCAVCKEFGTRWKRNKRDRARREGKEYGAACPVCGAPCKNEAGVKIHQAKGSCG